MVSGLCARGNEEQWRVPLEDVVVIADERFLVAKWLVAVDGGLGASGVVLVVVAIVGRFALPFCGGPGGRGWMGWWRRWGGERRVDEAVGQRNRIGGRRHGDAERDGGSNNAAAGGGGKVEVADGLVVFGVEDGGRGGRRGEAARWWVKLSRLAVAFSLASGGCCLAGVRCGARVLQ